MPQATTNDAADYAQIEVYGFNVQPGLVIVHNVRDIARCLVVMKAWRDSDSEFNHLVCRIADHPFGPLSDMPRGTRLGDTVSISLDYGWTVPVIGFCVNPNDRDDLDFGVSVLPTSVELNA